MKNVDKHIAISRRYICCHIDSDRERLALLKKFCNALPAHRADKESIAIDDILEDRRNLNVAMKLLSFERLFRILTSRQLYKKYSVQTAEFGRCS